MNTNKNKSEIKSNSDVEARVKTDACGHWSLTKPDKPCLFIARYNKIDKHPSFHYAVYDGDILCVTDIEENFSFTMEEMIDCEYFIIEYI